MDKRQLAAQLYLDAINGDNVTADQARQMAISAWEMAAIFEACDPNPYISPEARRSFESNMLRKSKGCNACYGSGGKGKSCKVCHGTGRIEE